MLRNMYRDLKENQGFMYDKKRRRCKCVLLITNKEANGQGKAVSQNVITHHRVSDWRNIG